MKLPNLDWLDMADEDDANTWCLVNGTKVFIEGKWHRAKRLISAKPDDLFEHLYLFKIRLMNGQCVQVDVEMDRPHRHLIR